MSQRLPWARLIAEALVVILSILAAFAIDAWWDGHQERGREQDLLAGMLDDFRSSRPSLEGRLDLARRMTIGTGALLEILDGPGVPGRQVHVPDSLVMAVIGGPTYEPTTNTLDAALASGEIELLRSPVLRGELAHWSQTLSDTMEDELEVRRIGNEQVVPLLSSSISLRPHFADLLAWSGGDPDGAGRLIAQGAVNASGSARITASSELIGALAMRHFYVGFAAADLEALLGSLDRAVALLEDQVGS